MKFTLILLAAAGVWGAEESTRTIEKSFPLVGNSRAVFVCGMNGAITVTAGDGNEVRFLVKERLAAPTKERLEELRKEVDVVFAHEAGAVRAGVKGPWSNRDCGAGGEESRDRSRRRWEGRETRIEHEFTVTVPREARLELRSVNGSIAMSGTSGNYEVHTVNGSIEMNDVEGAGEVATVNGGVRAIYRKNPAADTGFRTVNGKLNLYFEPGLNADFKMRTVNGKVFTDFDMTPAGGGPPEAKGMKVIHRRGTSGELRAGNGGVKISTVTVNGEILIHSLAKGRP